MAKKKEKSPKKKVKSDKPVKTDVVKTEGNEGRPGNTLSDGRPYRGH